MKPLLDGQTEMEQMSKMMKIFGSPSIETWPELSEMEIFRSFTLTKHKLPNRLREMFPVQSYTGGNILTDMGFHLLSQMLCYNPSDRITAQDALRHPYWSEMPIAQSQELMPTFPIPSDRTGKSVNMSERADEIGQQLHKANGASSRELKHCRCEENETNLATRTDKESGFYL